MSSFICSYSNILKIVYTRDMTGKFQILEIDGYSMRIQCHQNCSKEDFISYFHLSKRSQAHYGFPKKDQYQTKEQIVVEFPYEPISQPSFVPIDIVYEDETILLVNKPPFLLVHGDGQTKDTLQDRVNGYLLQNGWPHPAYAVHRIDRETSGLVLFSKNSFFKPSFDDLFAKHHLIKEYVCVVEGSFPYSNKSVSQAIGRNRHQSNTMLIHKHGKNAITHFTCIKRSDNTSLLRAQIETGRKHQIRVHSSYLGFPIVNDPIYGKVNDQRGLLLQNIRMVFVHPIFQIPLDIQLEIDPRFKE